MIASLLPCRGVRHGRHASAGWVECSAGFCKRVVDCSVYGGRGVRASKLLVILFKKRSHMSPPFISNGIPRLLELDFFSTSWLHPDRWADTANDVNSQRAWRTVHMCGWSGRIIHESKMHSCHNNIQTKRYGCFVWWYDGEIQIASILHACWKSKPQHSQEFG